MIIEVNYLFKEELWLFNVVIVIYNTVYDKLRNKMEYKNEQCAKPLIRINNRGYIILIISFTTFSAPSAISTIVDSSI